MRLTPEASGTVTWYHIDTAFAAQFARACIDLQMAMTPIIQERRDECLHAFILHIHRRNLPWHNRINRVKTGRRKMIAQHFINSKLSLDSALNDIISVFLNFSLYCL